MTHSDLERSLIIPIYLLSVMYGVVIGFFAFGLAGGGHGFVTAPLSALAIVLVPLGYTAWVFRKRRVGLILATLTLVITFALDVLILSDTGGMKRVRGNNSYWFEIWFVLWTIWRLPVAGVWLLRLFRRRQTL